MRHYTIAFSFLCLLALTGCGSTKVLPGTTTFQVIEPPAELYVCPDLKESDYPTGNFTQLDVAIFIATLSQRGNVCKNSLDAIRDYVEDAKRNIETNGRPR